MKTIQEAAKRQARPVKAVQFGEGNFLRAFVDYMFDAANEKGIFDGSVAIVKPTNRGNLSRFEKQDNLYTVVLRGKADGRTVDEARLITCVSEAVSPYEDRECLKRLGETESVKYIISNTTEAGIALTGTEQLTDTPCDSFPGKLTQLLYARYCRFEGAQDMGVTVLPAELIDNNGGQLRALVLELAKKWNLEEEFATWINKACRFCNTLVDRIVTGHPKEAETLCEKLGYEDVLLDVGEPFALWVIECEDCEALAKELPLDKAGLPVVFTKDLTPYHERKVRILNGAHTSSVLAAYLVGENIVRGMMKRPLTRAYVEKAVYTELLPTVPLPEDDVKAFADAVMERFENPFIDHSVLAIALNSVSKWKARVLPGLKGYLAMKGTLPKCLTFSFAALIAFYAPEEQRDGLLVSHRGDDEYTVRDDAKVMDFFWENRAGCFEKSFVEKLAARTDFWGEDLTALNGFIGKVYEDLVSIRELGMTAAMEKLMEE